MIIYLEFIKIQTDPTEEPEEPIRYKVKNKKEALRLYKRLRSRYPPESYEARIHYCYHDEDPTKPCNIEPL